MTTRTKRRSNAGGAIACACACLTHPPVRPVLSPSAPERREWPVSGNPHLEGSRSNLARDDESIVDIEAVMDSGVEPRLAGLLRHSEVAAALVAELRIQDETDRPRDAGVVARIRGVVGKADRQANCRIDLRRPWDPVRVFRVVAGDEPVHRDVCRDRDLAVRRADPALAHEEARDALTLRPMLVTRKRCRTPTSGARRARAWLGERPSAASGRPRETRR